MNLNEAGRLVAVIDNRIRRLIRSEAQVETTWGEVCGISADGMLASAYLYGSSDPSEGFRIPGSLALAVGDKVKVAWDGRGDRYVVEAANPGAFKKVAINASTGEVAVGDGTSEPTPLPTDADVTAVVATHEADPDSHHAESHTHNADGSGAVAHTSLTGISADDHHSQGHSHNVAEDGTTLAPAVLIIPGGSHVTVGSSFPVSPSANDLHYHTTRDMWFKWNATQGLWLSTTQYRMTVGPIFYPGMTWYTITISSSHTTAVPMLGANSDVWLESVESLNYIDPAGSNLSASHKWVGTFSKRIANNSDTTISTINLDSGSENWRRTTDVINDLLNDGTTHYMFSWGWTKTGTPGAMFHTAELTYRMVG